MFVIRQYVDSKISPKAYKCSVHGPAHAGVFVRVISDKMHSRKHVVELKMAHLDRAL